MILFLFNRPAPTETYTLSLHDALPIYTVAPQITGDPRLFRTLSCTRGDWDDTAADRYAVTYSWFRNSVAIRSEEHTSELQSQSNLVCRLLLEKKNNRRSHSCPS